MERKEDFYVIQEEKPSWKNNKKIKWIAGITIGFIMLILVIVVPISVFRQQDQSKNNAKAVDIKPNNNNNNNNPATTTNNNHHKQQNNANHHPTNNNPNNSTTTTIKQTVQESNKTITKSDSYYSSFKNDEGIENGFIVSKYANLTRIQTKSEEELANKKRIFVVGDVHGCVDELNKLITEINYNPSTDQLVLAGDMLSKGPDSNGVLTRARELGAWCVRGNHDDKVVRFKNFEKKEGLSAMSEPKDIMPEGDVPDPLKFKNAHAKLSRTISDENFEYLSNCPSILRIPSLDNSVVVHGGLDPTIKDIVQQQPVNVMTMRHIDDNGDPTEEKKIGQPWADIWNEAQKKSETPMTVYYGHDAHLGLNIKQYSFGLDSGCVYGRKLSTIEMRTKKVYQVPCAEHVADD
ncbi:unnamed protein product [Cunninghamella echinulata]